MALKKKGAARRGKAAAAGAEAAGDGVQGDAPEALAALVGRLAARFTLAPTSGGDGAVPAGALVQAQAPELAALLRQLRQRLTSLRSAAGTALDRFGAGSSVEADVADPGSSGYVEMKVQLLLSYLTCLVYYLLLKARGVPVRDHPVVQRLIWIRALLEKLRPVDQRLQYQIGKLLQWSDGQAPKAAVAGAEGAAAAAAAKTLRPGELATGVEDEGDEAAEEGAAAAEADKASDGVYRPPRIAQMEYTGDHVTLKERAERDLKRTESRLERSQFMRSLREEFTDAPTEIHGSSQRSAKAEKAARVFGEVRDFEEDNMIRMRSSKRELKDRSRLLKEGRATSSGVASLNELTADFHEMTRSARPGAKGRKGGGSVLDDYKAAKQRASDARGVVNSVLDGAAGGGRKGGGKGGGKGKRGPDRGAGGGQPGGKGGKKQRRK